jgi:hypothetical protein
MVALVATIHDFLGGADPTGGQKKTWMVGTRPTMTAERMLNLRNVLANNTATFGSPGIERSLCTGAPIRCPEPRKAAPEAPPS